MIWGFQLERYIDSAFSSNLPVIEGAERYEEEGLAEAVLRRESSQTPFVRHSHPYDCLNAANMPSIYETELMKC